MIASRVSDALHAAERLIAQASVTAVGNTVDTLLERMRTAVTNTARGEFAAAHTELLKHKEALQTHFAAALREKVDAAVSAKGSRRAHERTDWDALSLVEPDQIEERISFERIGQIITHECEAELRELSPYMSAMLDHSGTDPERNPLRGNVVGSALHAAIEGSIGESPAQKLLSSELGQALARALPSCYRAIIEDLNARGFRPADLAVRRAAPPIPPSDAGPGSPAGEAQSRSTYSTSPSRAGSDPRFEETRSRWERSTGGRAADGQAPYSEDSRLEDARRRWERSTGGRAPDGRAPYSEDSRLEDARRRWERSTGGRAPDGRTPYSEDSRLEDARRRWERSASGRPSAPGDMDTLRSWNSSILGRHGNIDPVSVPPEDFSDSAASLLDRLVRGGIGSSSGNSRVPSSYNAAPPQADAELMALLRRINEGVQASPPGLPASMAFGVPTNIIRANQDELVRASQGKLDHLLIELVSNLFDQILSDSRVSPRIAVLIARLQLPVLRVALRDPNFFSSRRHPVRRFVNRVAALGIGIDDFDNGFGKELLGRINRLIAEIVDGDFDQIVLYEAKLIDLEAFTAEQLRAEVRASPAGETVAAKEFEWLLLQHFPPRLQAALEPISIPPYLKEFLGREWAQVILTASLRHGATSAEARLSRRTGYDLVLSIQPKLTLKQRMDFISSLPALMTQLNHGMALIDWPGVSRAEFLGKLVSEHAGSLKAALSSELDYKMLRRQVEAAFKTPMPTREELEQAAQVSQAVVTAAPAEVGHPAALTAVIEQRFLPEEAKKIGLVAEDMVNWSTKVMGDAAVAADSAAVNTPPVPTAVGNSTAPDAAAEGAAVPALEEPAEPTEGPQLRHHLELGISYQLQLRDHWENVRLAYMSPARNLFLFTHGSRDRQAISMTARMLERLCEAGRMRTLEAVSLLDRATAGVQRHLAALKLPAERAAG